VKGELVHRGGWEKKCFFSKKETQQPWGGGQNWSQTGVFGLEVKTLLTAL